MKDTEFKLITRFLYARVLALVAVTATLGLLVMLFVRELPTNASDSLYTVVGGAFVALSGLMALLGQAVSRDITEYLERSRQDKQNGGDYIEHLIDSLA